MVVGRGVRAQGALAFLRPRGRSALCCGRDPAGAVIPTTLGPAVRHTRPEIPETDQIASQFLEFLLVAVRFRTGAISWEMAQVTSSCDPKGSMAFLQNQFRCPPMLGARRT